MILLASVLTVGALSACGGGDSTKVTGKAVDDGTTITMWTRAATQTQSQRLVDAYNASHKNKVRLTAIPTDNYAQKVGSAAGSKKLPDVFASDVIFAPNFASKGLYLDITDRIDALPFKDALAPSHMKLGTSQGRQYTVPHVLDLSVLFYNKALYKKAGLDPDKPPTTMQEFADQARAVNKLGGDVHGTFFGGNCGGCLVFTFWPSIWASGGQVMNDDGTQSTLDTPQAAGVFDIYRSLIEDDVMAPGVKTEAGATWTGVFPKGNIGVMPMPSTTLGTMPANLDVGVAPIPGLDGGQSTFVGGDVVGISANSTHPDQAWDFLSWTLSDTAQVEVLAKNHDVTARTDLADNKYSKADPRVALINNLVAKGETPYSLNFQQTFNDPNGVWLSVARRALFTGEPAGTVFGEDNGKVTASLKQQ